MGDTQSVNITIPETLSDITLERYKKFMLMVGEENSDELAVYHFCGLTPTQQQGMRKVDLLEVQNQLALVLNEKPALVKTFKHRGIEYGFHPKLEDISLGEYIDLESYLKEPYKNAEKALGVLYRPITKQLYGRHSIEVYDPDKHTGQTFQELGADIFLGCLLFFYRLEIKLQIATLQSLENQQEMKNQPLTSKQTSQRSGAGIALSIKSLEGIYSRLMK
jgi:hypothetical protein